MATAQADESTLSALILKNGDQLKLVTLINECSDQLRSMLHGRGNMPTHKVLLYQQLLPFKKHLKHLGKDQLDIVFPKNGQTDSKTFDISILCEILINCCKSIQAPIGGWKIKSPQVNDFRDGAEIIRIRNARNDVMHGKSMTLAQYNQLWNTIEAILNRLGYDVSNIMYLKSSSIKNLLLKDEMFKLKVMQAKIDVLEQDKEDIKQNKNDIKKIQYLQETTKDNTSYLLFTNHQNDFVVQFNNQWSIHHVCITDSITKQEKLLCNNDDYIVENRNGRLLLIIKNQNTSEINKITISDEEKKRLVVIEGDDFEQKSIVKCERLEDNECLLKLPVQLHLTNVAVNLENNDWKELEEDSLKFNKLYLFVKIKFKDGNSYRFKVVGKRIHSDQQSEFYSEDIQFEACKHQNSALNIGWICHGLPGCLFAVISELNNLNFSYPKNVKYIVDGKRELISDKKWDQLCDEYVNRYFEKPYKQHIKLPVDCVKDTEIGCFGEVLTNWCSGKDKCSVGSMVLTDYDTYKHAEFLGYDLSDVKKKLYLTAERRECNSRILVYEPSQHTFLNIRVLLHADTAGINEALLACTDDIKMQAMINRDIIVDSNVVFIGIIVIPDSIYTMYSKGKNNILCNSCSELILSTSVLKDLALFKEWEKRKLQEIVRNLKKEHDLKEKPENYEDTMKSYFKQTIGFMATAKVYVPSLRTMKMPSLSSNVDAQVKSVLLTREQQKLIGSLENKLILTGSFGSGKSIIGQLKLKQLYERAEGEVRVYYVCCQSQCLFQSTIKEIANQSFNDTKKNVKIIATDLLQLKHDLDLDANVNLSSVVRKVYDKNENMMMHFIFDEYDAEKLDRQEAASMKRLIEDETILGIKDSTIMIITQSMEKHREFVKSISDSQEERYKHEKYQFHLTGLTKFELKRTMRTTKAINELIKICIDKIVAQPNIFKHPNFTANAVSEDDKRKEEPLATLNKKSQAPQSSKAVITKTNKTTVKSINVNKESCSTDVEVKSNFTLDNEDCLDYLLKRLGLENVNEGENTITKFKFNGTTRIGHNITGERPVLVQFSRNREKSNSENYTICLLAVLQKLCEDSNNVVALCFDHYIAKVLQNLCKLSEKVCIEYTPALTNSHHKMMKDDVLKLYRLGNSVLVTDSVGFTGMEAERVWLFVDKSDYYLKQHLVESLGRCTDQLVIVEYENLSVESKPDDTLKTIIQEWKDERLTNNINVCVTDGDYQDDLLVELECTDAHKLYAFNPNSQKKFKIAEVLTVVEDSNVLLDDDKDMMEEAIKSLLHDPYTRDVTGSHDHLGTSINKRFTEEVNVNLDIIDFVDARYFSQIIGRKGESIKRLNREFKVMLRVDRKRIKIHVNGNRKSKLKARAYFKLFVHLKKEERRHKPLRQCFVAGCSSSDMVSFVQTNCPTSPKHLEIKLLKPLENTSKLFSNIENFEAIVEKILSDAKRDLTKNRNVIYDVMVHHGKFNYFGNVGECSVGNLLSNGIRVFEKLSLEAMNFHNFVYQRCENNVTRIDMKIHAQMSGMELCYVLFTNEEFSSFLTCEEIGQDRHFYQKKVGAGYFSAEKICKSNIDVVDPLSNVSIRTQVNAYETTPASLKHLNAHILSLKNFLESIQLSKNLPIGVEYSEMPEGYMIYYLRKSERSSYKLAKSTVLRTSKELITIRNGLSTKERESDLFLCSEILQKTDWDISTAKSALQEMFLCSEHFLR